MTHICVGNLTIIGSDNGLAPCWCQAIIWTKSGVLLIGPLGTNFNEILSEILKFSLKKMRLNVSSVKWQPFCVCLSVLMGVCALLWGIAAISTITVLRNNMKYKYIFMFPKKKLEAMHSYKFLHPTVRANKQTNIDRTDESAWRLVNLLNCLENEYKFTADIRQSWGSRKIN